MISSLSSQVDSTSGVVEGVSSTLNSDAAMPSVILSGMRLEESMMRFKRFAERRPAQGQFVVEEVTFQPPRLEISSCWIVKDDNRGHRKCRDLPCGSVTRDVLKLIGL